MAKMTVIEILEALEQTSGSLAKRSILDENSGNGLLKQAFVAAGDPYVVYFVNKFKMPAPRSTALYGDDDILYSFLNELLPMLSTRAITGNAAKDDVVSHFADMTELQQKWCLRILLKNMRNGVQTTVNKVWPGAIKTFDVALAETLKTSHGPNGISIDEPVNYPVRVEPKLDGLRCIAVKQNGVVTFYTRNGTVLETLPRIKAALEAGKYDNVVLDGEALAETGDWNTSASIVMSRKTQKDDACMIYNVFDHMPLDCWVDQKCEFEYSGRAFCVGEVIKTLPKDAPVKQVPGKTVHNESELLAFYAASMDEGHEGLMLKDLHAPYRFKRSDALLKMKPVMTHELVVVGHYEGRRGSKREGLWGGFEAVASNGIITRIGGGFSDVMKAEIQLDPNSYIGKVIECECQPDPQTHDGLTSEGKLRFPVWCRWRDASDVDPKLMKAFETYLSR